MPETQTNGENRYLLNSEQIRGYLPHRFPFLLVDRILEIEPKGSVDDLEMNSSKVGIRVVGLKCVSVNEPFFQGHFPGFSIMTGVLIIESMAQVASFSLYPYLERDIGKLQRDFECILLGVDEVRFRRPVVPGDVLVTESIVTKCRNALWAFDVKATVNGEKVAEAQLMANMIVKGKV
jgi:3-hydroxyacyl-[acyl-carrier-protein] dehydratase